MPGDPDDPIDSGDPDILRHEILRQRDLLLGLEARTEVLDDRIAELEDHVESLGAELGRHPLIRISRRATRLLRRG